MCGIAGIITRSADVARQALPRMTAAQAHRGPNDCGEHYLPFGNHTLALGHRRLSIIDLSDCGHQPMVHPRTGDQLVFNGEVYNFRALRADLEARGAVFRGHSDSEVLLHAMTEWGVDCVRRLEGMYAFAFYNARAGELVLARDPLGIKPLYVARAGGSLLFASEVRALLASGLVADELDTRGVAGLLAFGAVQHPGTIFRHVRSFPPGSWQVIPRDRPFDAAEPTPYWTFPPPAPGPHPPAGEVTARVRRTIEDAVRDHLVADVPVGVFLSSGIDSTIVAGLAARHSPHLRAFTVGFADNPDLSELTLASETAAAFGLEHVQCQVAGRDAEAATLQWLRSMDLPSMDGLNVYIISKAVVAEGITVALSGQGGDELFGGYPSFADVPRYRAVMRRATWVPAALRRAMARAVAARRSHAVRQKILAIAGGDGSLLSLYAQRRRVLSNPQLASLGFQPAALGLTADFLDPAAIGSLTVLDQDPVWTVSHLESRLYLGNILLRDGDVNGMAHCLEIRVPMLDRRVLDLACALPGPVRLPNGRADKHLLRTAFPDLLRPALLRQGKLGFTLPLRRWMLGPLRDVCQAGLDELRRNPAFQSRGVDAIWNAFLREPESPIWTRAFTLCVLGLYLRDRATATAAATAAAAAAAAAVPTTTGVDTGAAV